MSVQHEKYRAIWEHICENQNFPKTRTFKPIPKKRVSHLSGAFIQQEQHGLKAKTKCHGNGNFMTATTG